MQIGINKVSKAMVGFNEAKTVMLGTDVVHSSTAACIPMTDSAAIAFIAAPASHTRRGITMENLPEDGVFPYGQNMHKGAWGAPTTGSSYSGFANDGFTVMGPVDGTENPGRVALAHQYGLKLDVLIRNITLGTEGCGGTAFNYTVCEYDRNPSGVRSKIRNSINTHLTEEAAIGQQVIQNWWSFEEETVAHGDRVPVNEAMGEEVRSTDNKGYGHAVSSRHLFCSQNPDSNYYNCRSMASGMTMFGNVSPQTDWHGCSYEDTPGCQFNTQRNRHWYYQVAVEMNAQSDQSGNSDWNMFFSCVMTLRDVHSYYYIGSENRDDWFVKIRAHDIIAVLLGGVDGYNFYKFVDLGYNDWGRNKAAIRAGTKMITDTGLDKVLLWGDRRSDVNMSHTGTQSIRVRRQKSAVPNEGTVCHPGGGYCDGNPPGGNCADYTNDYYTDPVVFRNIQYKDRRYIIAINSHRTERITTTFSGLPSTTQLSASNMLVDDVKGITGGSFSAWIQPESFVAYEVGPADGYCGGDEPPTPEVNVTFSATDPAFQSWVNGITGSAALNDVYFTDPRISNRSRGEFYTYETADYLVFYCPAGQNINANFDMAVFADVCTVDDYLGGKYTAVSVGNSQPLTYNASSTMGGMIYTKTA